MSSLELQLLTALDANRTLSTWLVADYKAGRKPSDATITAFMSIPAVNALRREYSDKELVTALADVLEAVLARMGE